MTIIADPPSKWTPLPMSAEEAKLLLDGASQIRRPVLWTSDMVPGMDAASIIEGAAGPYLRVPCYDEREHVGREPAYDRTRTVSCSLGYPKARLYVQEPWRVCGVIDDGPLQKTQLAWRSGGYKWLNAPFKALFPGQRLTMRWRGVQTMPRWSSRMALRLLDVRLERLLATSVADLYRMGFVPPGTGTQVGFSSPADNARDKLRLFWNNRYEARYAYATNPWVWVLDVKRVPPRWRLPE